MGPVSHVQCTGRRTPEILLEAGAQPNLVQKLPGHSTVALTLNTYSHLTAGLCGEAARTMDRVLDLPRRAAGERVRRAALAFDVPDDT